MNRFLAGYARVFDRHFFTNQHIEATLLEEKMAHYYGFNYCVSYSNYMLLICSVVDEFMSPSSCNYNASAALLSCSSLLSQRTHGFIMNTRKLDSSRYAFVDTKCAHNIHLNDVIASSHLMLEDACDTTSSLCIAIQCHHDGLTASGAFMLTSSLEVFQILQNSRCSYGVQCHRPVSVSSNGRFSEFQAVSLDGVIS